jgi:hypothetical protein
MFKFNKNVEKDNNQKTWKQKAKERGFEIKKLKKQIKELSVSKNKLNNKVEHLKAENKIIEDILKKKEK